MKLVRFLFLVPFLMAFQCDVQPNLEDDRLFETGLFGRWEIVDESTNGISDLLPKCCLFFEFYPDKNTKDQNGFFNFTDRKSENYEGVFTLDPAKQMITFEGVGKQPIVYSYVLNPNQEYLSFQFIEEGEHYSQNWKRIQ